MTNEYRGSLVLYFEIWRQVKTAYNNRGLKGLWIFLIEILELWVITCFLQFINKKGHRPISLL